jgi:hypothetical protein
VIEAMAALSAAKKFQLAAIIGDVAAVHYGR